MVKVGNIENIKVVSKLWQCRIEGRYLSTEQEKSD
jgi:hypothetical protein